MKRFLKKLAAAGMALLMAGCGKTADPEIIDGGTTKNNDPDAPKVIESTEITEFSVAVFLAERCREEEDHRFDFQVKPDENDKVIDNDFGGGLFSCNTGICK
jgi:hypothetical protein